MALNEVKEKTRELLKKPAEKLKAIPAFLGKLRVWLSSIPMPAMPGPVKSAKAKISSLTSRVFDRIPAEKRRPVFLALGGAVVLLVVLIVFSANSGASKKSAPMDLSAGPVIPSEDLFIPGEPDFLPGFLLEREPRHSWSLEEIRPYWRIPGPANQELWRGELKSAVDKIMESVP